jgi:hypothetical protein
VILFCGMQEGSCRRLFFYSLFGRGEYYGYSLVFIDGAVPAQQGICLRRFSAGMRFRLNSGVPKMGTDGRG